MTHHTTKGSKKIKAWAFLADDPKKGKYFITDQTEVTEICLKKPPSRKNPFDYFGNLSEWKPTQITITF